MLIGSEGSSVGPRVNFTSASFEPAGNEPCSIPVVGSSAAHVSLSASSRADPGLLPSASVAPSVVQRTRQPNAIGKSLGAALSAAACARGLSGILMTPAWAIARAIDIPLAENDPARNVAVSIDVRRAASFNKSVPVPPPPSTAYARLKPIHFQSGDGPPSQ